MRLLAILMILLYGLMAEMLAKFSIPIKAKDQFHHDLLHKRSLSLLMAYSQSDDFTHHSIMRTAIDIRL